jgi:hypothetical protein
MVHEVEGYYAGELVASSNTLVSRKPGRRFHGDSMFHTEASGGKSV